jgi:hypothetical protein
MSFENKYEEKNFNKLSNVLKELHNFSLIQGFEINKEKLFIYLFNSLTEEFYLYNIHKSNINEKIYVVTKYGDILLNIKIEGNFSKAQLFQYDENGNKKIIYDEIYSNGILNPFPNGLPLMHLGTYLYISILYENDLVSPSYNILSKYAFLNNNDRLLLSKLNEIKIKHKNNDLYEIVNCDDYGHSPNKLIKIN